MAQDEEVDVDALIAQANKHAANALEGEDEVSIVEEMFMSDMDFDMNEVDDQDLLEEYAALGLGGDTDDEAGEDVKEDGNDSKADEVDEDMFEGLQKSTLADIPQVHKTFKKKKNEKKNSSTNQHN
ncbi:hypothetical protein RFI_11216 [Reticulomyxa filosa]|uniref:Uncharacterized protein n=1 Tax=Reticulomyxa filosa TaxID=46433 RepID=X6NIY0_RETFI|nr:hypothetical protein RFI_11216 [Reticulomyxa filosa]|eukprot:ETO25921.1 hypothetical protein RFI_11216 [Reticulomyxa filosa]